MSAVVFVPKDLFAPIVSERLLWPSIKRQLVAACVLGGGGESGEWVSVESLRAGRDCWPLSDRDRPARNVLTILLELERLGLLEAIDETSASYVVRVRKEAA